MNLELCLVLWGARMFSRTHRTLVHIPVVLQPLILLKQELASTSSRTFRQTNRTQQKHNHHPFGRPFATYCAIAIGVHPVAICFCSAEFDRQVAGVNRAARDNEREGPTKWEGRAKRGFTKASLPSNGAGENGSPIRSGMTSRKEAGMTAEKGLKIGKGGLR